MALIWAQPVADGRGLLAARERSRPAGSAPALLLADGDHLFGSRRLAPSAAMRSLLGDRLESLW